MSTTTFILLISLLALVCSACWFPIVLRFAKKRHIVDQPGKRKCQNTPIPVLGGTVVVLGMLIPFLLIIYHFQVQNLYFFGTSILALLIIGTIDDVRGLSVWIRFLLEILIIWVIIWQPNIPDPSVHINSLHGLWQRQIISPYTAIPLTIVAGVGILNSINLIDGVDGYSSGFGIVANLLFSAIFFLSHNIAQGLLSLVVSMALIPFYLHNVFGRDSKMFLGDGGSLVLGIVMVWNVFSMLSHNTSCLVLEQQGVGLVALSLAVLAIPVFDTIRVMTGRLMRGESPFQPDRTHLHHLFLNMHFSHLATSTSIVASNLVIVLVWYISYRLGASIDVQFYIVFAISFLATFGFYNLMCWCQQRNNTLWQRMCHIGDSLNIQQRACFLKMQRLVDCMA